MLTRDFGAFAKGAVATPGKPAPEPASPVAGKAGRLSDAPPVPAKRVETLATGAFSPRPSYSAGTLSSRATAPALAPAKAETKPAKEPAASAKASLGPKEDMKAAPVQAQEALAEGKKAAMAAAKESASQASTSGGVDVKADVKTAMTGGSGRQSVSTGGGASGGPPGPAPGEVSTPVDFTPYQTAMAIGAKYGKTPDEVDSALYSLGVEKEADINAGMLERLEALLSGAGASGGAGLGLVALAGVVAFLLLRGK